MVPVLRIAGCVLVLLLHGCAAPPAVTPTPVVAVPEAAPAVAERLDIGIVVFDPGLPQDASQQRQQGVFPLIRRAESRYLPSVLRETLQRSDQWGVVRVMPKTSQSAELLITGRIEQSDGETLTLAIRAADSTGRVWLDQSYSGTAVAADIYIYIYMQR